MQIQITSKNYKLPKDLRERLQNELEHVFQKYNLIVSAALGISELKRDHWEMDLSIVPTRGPILFIHETGGGFLNTFQSLLDKADIKVERYKSRKKEISRQTL